MGFGNVSAERVAIESTYEGFCTVQEITMTKNTVTKATEQQRVTVLLNQPCALSQTSLRTTQQTDTTNDIDYDAKLFIAPEVTIKAGSRIHVEQHGMSKDFERVGKPFRYPTHQEIMLKEVGHA